MVRCWSQPICLQDNVMQLCCSLDSNVKEHRKTQTVHTFYKNLRDPEHKKYKVLETQGLPGGLCDICTDKERVYGDSQRLKINRIAQQGFFLKIDFSNKCNSNV